VSEGTTSITLPTIKSNLSLGTKKVSLPDKRKKCCVSRCKNLGAWKNSTKGKVYRSPMCSYHNGLRWGRKKTSWKRAWMKKINTTPCSICGWDRDKVDIHRVVQGKDGGAYKQDNVIGLCPNCHRLVHSGIIKL
jgi:hypothetical protein